MSWEPRREAGTHLESSDPRGCGSVHRGSGGGGGQKSQRKPRLYGTGIGRLTTRRGVTGLCRHVPTWFAGAGGAGGLANVEGDTRTVSISLAAGIVRLSCRQWGNPTRPIEDVYGAVGC